MRLLVRPRDHTCAGIFMGRPVGTQWGEEFPTFPALYPDLRVNRFQGNATVNKKRELLWDHRPASAHNAALPR